MCTRRIFWCVFLEDYKPELLNWAFISCNPYKNRYISTQEEREIIVCPDIYHFLAAIPAVSM